MSTTVPSYVQYVGQRERKDQERFLYNIAARAAYPADSFQNPYLATKIRDMSSASPSKHATAA